LELLGRDWGDFGEELDFGFFVRYSIGKFGEYMERLVLPC
jgi:hypothetical protein